MDEGGGTGGMSQQSTTIEHMGDGTRIVETVVEQGLVAATPLARLVHQLPGAGDEVVHHPWMGDMGESVEVIEIERQNGR